MNILLPTDFSENSKNAAAYALKCFGNVPCTFHLLHALPLSSEKNNSKEVQVSPEFYANFEQFSTFLNSKKVNPQHEFKFMFKANYLIETVRELVLEKKIDLIIMGTKGITNKKNTIIGKNTSDVMMKVKCPVMAISENAVFKGYNEILFPTDYKIHYSGEMLNILLNLISLSKASVKILEIFSSDTEPSKEQVESRALLQNYFSPQTPLFHAFYSSKNPDRNRMLMADNNFDMIAIAAKNLNICQKLLNSPQNHQIPFINKLPLLILH